MTEWAIVGAGWIAAVHGLAVDALGDHVGAVCSRRPGAAAALAMEVGASVVDRDDLPAGAQVVAVASAPGAHAVDALQAVAGGAAALVETPLATTLDDADRLVRVEAAGASISYAENLLFSDVVSTVRSEVASLGPLQHLSARALVPRPPRRRPRAGEDPHAWARLWGGGVLCDVGVHALAVLLRTAEPAAPRWVRATFDADDDDLVEDRAVVEIGFDSDLVAHLETSWRVDSPVWDLQAAAADGVVVASLLPDVTVERDGAPVAVADPPTGDHPPQLHRFGYVDQVRAARDSAAAGVSAPESNAAFGRDVLSVLCGTAVAARTGEAVPLPFAGPRDVTPVELWHGAEVAAS